MSSSGEGNRWAASATVAAQLTPDADGSVNVRVFAPTPPHNTNELDGWEMTNRLLLSTERGRAAAMAGRISPTLISNGIDVVGAAGGDAKLLINLATFDRRSIAARFLAFFLIDLVFILLVGGSSTVSALSSSDGSVCEASAGGSSGG